MKLMSSDVLFCLTNNPRPKDIQFKQYKTQKWKMLIKKKKKYSVLIFSINILTISALVILL